MSGAIHVCPYEMRPRRAPNARTPALSRRGALLRIGEGFADLHPWPELGDPPLEEHLQSLHRGTPTRLAGQSLLCAGIDGAARRERRSLFDGLAIPRSHALVDLEDPDLEGLAAAGFGSIKVKAGFDAGAEARRLATLAPRLAATGLRLRIDFNATGTLAGIVAFVRSLPGEAARAIEFLEDPASPSEWSALRERTGLAIAADRIKPSDTPWDVTVLKPAAEPCDAPPAGPIVFTSSMDHPLGQMWAAFVAARYCGEGKGVVRDCGLLSHGIYEPTPFVEALRVDGPHLRAPSGTGLGFDELLERLPWTPLA